MLCFSGGAFWIMFDFDSSICGGKASRISDTPSLSGKFDM